MIHRYFSLELSWAQQSNDIMLYAICIYAKDIKCALEHGKTLGFCSSKSLKDTRKLKVLKALNTET